MSRKAVKTRRIVSAQSLATDYTSDWITISQLDNVGITLACNGVSDNTGHFDIDVRMKQPSGDGGADGGLFSEACELTLSAVPTLADADDNFFIELHQLPADQFRVRYTAAGVGTPDGTLEMFVSTKTIGA
jgi:hypothetical protein